MQVETISNCAQYVIKQEIATLETIASYNQGFTHWCNCTSHRVVCEASAPHQLATKVCLCRERDPHHREILPRLSEGCH